MYDKMRTWVEIDTHALIENLKTAKKLVGERKVMCVVKGDAHGHGAVECSRVLEKNGADAFAVACLSEGIELRKSGIKAPILLLGWTPAECASEIAKYDLTQSVFDEDYAAELNTSLEGTGNRLPIHIKLDTGMSRTGILAQGNAAQAAQAVIRIAQMRNLKITGIFTHYAAADMPERDDFTAQQLSNYRAVLEELEKQGFKAPIVRHTGNSASILYHPETYFDMVRMGVMMYGLYPNGQYDPCGSLQPILSLKSRVAQVKTIPAGAHISYGCTTMVTEPTRIAIVACGYADAYPRALSNQGAYALINGVRCPQIGRVCMDMSVFVVGDADVKRGDEVILYGKGGMPMEEVAALTGSINCEPLTLLTNRVKKVYL